MYNINKNIEIYSNDSYYVDSNEEYYNGKCIVLFLKTIRKIWWKKRQNIRTFFKLETWKFPPEETSYILRGFLRVLHLLKYKKFFL